MELTREQRADALASLKQYAERNFAEPLGDLATGLLLDFFLQEIGPLVYNKAIEDAQTRMQHRVAEIDGELFEVPFTYWSRSGKRGR